MAEEQPMGIGLKPGCTLGFLIIGAGDSKQVGGCEGRALDLRKNKADDSVGWEGGDAHAPRAVVLQ